MPMNKEIICRLQYLLLELNRLIYINWDDGDIENVEILWAKGKIPMVFMKLRACNNAMEQTQVNHD